MTPALEAQRDAAFPAGRYFIGSSAFVAANLALAGRPDAPHFYQFNAGYWLTERDAVSRLPRAIDRRNVLAD